MLLGAVCLPGAIHTDDTDMRLAGIESGGFYPYPIHLAEACKRSGASWSIPPLALTQARLLDSLHSDKMVL
jgi:hypothetical protein